MVFGMMLVGGLVAGGVAAHYANKDQYKSMAREQEQEDQFRQAQARAEKAERAAQAAELQAAQIVLSPSGQIGELGQIRLRLDDVAGLGDAVTGSEIGGRRAAA